MTARRWPLISVGSNQMRNKAKEKAAPSAANKWATLNKSTMDSLSRFDLVFKLFIVEIIGGFSYELGI